MNIPSRNIYIQLKRNSTYFCRNYAKVTKKGCKPKCECPEPPKDTRIVEEKKCILCSFTNWKPKVRKEIEDNIEEMQRKKKPMKCYAGMVFKRPMSKCKAAQWDPFKKKCCGPKEAGPKPAPPPKPKAEIQVPEADWDSNCKR